MTSNAIRHKFVANMLAQNSKDALVIVECKKNDSLNTKSQDKTKSLIEEHFNLRYHTESEMFAGNDVFFAKTLPLLAGEVNSAYNYNVIKNFDPDGIFIFGSSIIKEPLMSLVPPGRFINLHLGLSPYYRGSGTNFWPFVNEELDYVGSTILHIDAGIDTGAIIAHVRPTFEIGDNVHTIGCKVIKSSVLCLIKIMDQLKQDLELNRVKQWKVYNERYYRRCDFDNDALKTYKQNLENGLVEKYLNSNKEELRLIPLESKNMLTI
jgi:methionyl-tRNA formyltransferase